MATRLDAETALYGRWAGLLTFVYQRPADSLTGAFPVTNTPVVPTGTTTLYNDPLGYALSLLSYPATDPAGVVDGDITTLLTSDAATGSRSWYVLLDLAEYRLIRSMLGSFTDVTESDNGRSASYDNLANRAKMTADELMKVYPAYLGGIPGFVFAGAKRFESWRDWLRP